MNIYIEEELSDEEQGYAYAAEQEARAIASGSVFCSDRTRKLAIAYLNGSLSRADRLGNRDIGESGPDTFGI